MKADRRAQEKAAFRAKLKESAQKQEKRIDSPLIWYNENDQPVCRVCKITLKSESNWPAHQVSRKHHEAIENLRASAAAQKRSKDGDIEPPVELQKPQSSSTMPSDFFEKHDSKRQKNDMGAAVGIKSVSLLVDSALTDDPHGRKEGSSAGQSSKVAGFANKEDRLTDTHPIDSKEKIETTVSKLGQMPNTIDNKTKRVLPEKFFDDNEKSKTNSSSQLTVAERHMDSSGVKKVGGAFPDDFFDSKESEVTQPKLMNQPSKMMDHVQVKQVKGSLPEKFFDNKDADLRARGIEPVKVDINDAYKEFEKEIQDDLQEVDERMEEEEIDAAEVWEETEFLEQKAYRENTEMIKKKLVEVKAARLAKGQQCPAFMGHESSDDSSSDEDDDEEIFAVDWRAKHL